MPAIDARAIADAYEHNLSATAASIAAEFNCSPDDVRAVCRIMGIKMRRGQSGEHLQAFREKALAQLRHKGVTNGVRRLVQKYGIESVVAAVSAAADEIEANDSAA